MSTKFIGHEVCKFPIQIQVVATEKCNLSCPWCIEESNMKRDYSKVFENIPDILHRLIWYLNSDSLLYNIVITGGEPLLSESFNKILESCEEVPDIRECIDSLGYKTKSFKIGVNTNGTITFKDVHKLSYIDITSFGDVIDAPILYYNSKRIPIRNQTVYRKKIFPSYDSIKDYIQKCSVKGYIDVVIREVAGNFWDKPSIIELINRINFDKDFRFEEFRINPYDLWIKYSSNFNIPVYFKRQDIEMQAIWEEINMDKITSIVIWPDGSISKSWNYKNKLKL